MHRFPSIQPLPPGSLPAAAVMRVIAVADRNQMDRLGLVQAVAMDFSGGSRRKIRRFANRLNAGDDLPTAMSRVRGLFEPSWSLAIRLAHQDDAVTDCVAAIVHWHDVATDSSTEASVDRHIFSHTLRATLTFSVAVATTSFMYVLVLPTLGGLLSEFEVQQRATFVKVDAWAYTINQYKYFATLIVFLFLLFRAPPIFRSLLAKLNPMLRTYGRRQAKTELLALLAIATRSSAPMAQHLALLAQHHPRRLVAARLRKASAEWDDGQPDQSWRMLGRRRIVSAGEAESLALAATPQARSYLLRDFCGSRFHRRRSLRFARLRLTEAFLLIVSATLTVAIAVVVFESLANFVQQSAMP